jgi:simple sugar transport system substrate-binding protein
VAHNFFNTGHDVVISGIDTTEALTVARQKKQEGKTVWAVPYDYVGACQGAPDVCLGVPYFNWGPGYITFIKAAMGKTWKPEWVWLGPDWKDINNHDTSTVGFIAGSAMPPQVKQDLDAFIGAMASGRLNLFKGPLNYQDGKPFVKAGEIASDRQIWYMEQLLEGMSGQSSTKN